MTSAHYVLLHLWAGLRKLAGVVWRNHAIKELVLLVATAAALVLITQFQELNAILDKDASASNLHTWWQATKVALTLTVAKQVIAWAIARLGGFAL